MSDNPGGGGTSDSVVILQEMLDRGVTNAVVATIVDPAVVEQAHAAGVVAQISGLLGDARSACRRLPDLWSRCAAHTDAPLCTGGKMDALHGPSLAFVSCYDIAGI